MNLLKSILLLASAPCIVCQDMMISGTLNAAGAGKKTERSTGKVIDRYRRPPGTPSETFSAVPHGMVKQMASNPAMQRVIQPAQGNVQPVTAPKKAMTQHERQIQEQKELQRQLAMGAMNRPLRANANQGAQRSPTELDRASQPRQVMEFQRRAEQEVIEAQRQAEQRAAIEAQRQAQEAQRQNRLAFEAKRREELQAQLALEAERRKAQKQAEQQAAIEAQRQAEQQAMKAQVRAEQQAIEAQEAQRQAVLAYEAKNREWLQAKLAKHAKRQAELDARNTQSMQNAQDAYDAKLQSEIQAKSQAETKMVRQAPLQVLQGYSSQVQQAPPAKNFGFKSDLMNDLVKQAQPQLQSAQEPAIQPGIDVPKQTTALAPIVSADPGIQNAVQSTAANKGGSVQKAMQLFSTLYSLQKSLPVVLSAASSVMQGNVLSATTMPQVQFFSTGNIAGLMGIANRLAANPYGISTWMYILTLAGLQLGGMSPVIPVFTTIVDVFGQTDFRSIIFNSYAGVQVSGLFGAIYSSLKTKLASAIMLISRAVTRVSSLFRTPQEEEHFGEATAQTIKLIDSPSYTLINTAKYGEFKNHLKGIAKVGDKDEFINLLQQAVSSHSEVAVYILLRQLGSFDFEDTHLGDIVKLVDSPTISGSLSAMVFQDERFESFFEDKVMGVGFYQQLDYYAEMFFSLAKLDPLGIVGVIDTLQFNEALTQPKHDLNCVFLRLTYADCPVGCNMKSVEKEFIELEKFPEALNIAVKKSQITGRIMRENDRLANPRMHRRSGKNRSRQVAMAKELLALFRKNYKMLVDKNLHSLIDMALLLGDSNDKLAIREWIKDDSSPLVYGIFLASTRPPTNSMPDRYRLSAPNELLTDIYLHHVRNPIRYHKAIGRDEHDNFEEINLKYDEEFEKKLLGRIDEKFSGREPDTKTAIVDLVIRLYFGIHPDKMPALRPLAHVKFLKQLEKRVSNFNKIKSAKARLRRAQNLNR